MLNFYGLEYSSKDHPGLFSLILYTSGCNLKCYNCHNRLLAGWDYEEKNKGSPAKIKKFNSENFYKKLSLEEIYLAIESELIDMVILCGGEFLINDIEKIKNTINEIKRLTPKILIRIDTNGSFPEKVKFLKEKKLVDGFAIDIKGAYWNTNYHKDLSKVMGIPINKIPDISSKILESIKIADGMPYTLFRTVNYPIVSPTYFDEIKKFTKNLISPHYFNDFIL